MTVLIHDTWWWFSIAFGIMLLSLLIMSLQGRYFYTLDVIVRKFSILDLEFAATPQELVKIISGIYKVPAFLIDNSVRVDTKRIISALKRQIITDFLLYMPATYGGIFLLCMKVATKMGPVGEWFFSILAWLQLVAFFLDAIENMYLLQKIKAVSKPSGLFIHRAYQLLEVFKWGFALTGSVCAISAIFHFWVSGLYSEYSYYYLLVILGEIMLFVIAGVVILRKQGD